MKSIIFLSLLIYVSHLPVVRNTVKISGTIKKSSSGEYIYLDELKSNQLNTVDSVKVSENGTFNFNGN